MRPAAIATNLDVRPPSIFSPREETVVRADAEINGYVQK